ncbi:MAG: hypothetical protein QJT81_02965 [Candidatus Thiothrix putei]|uniref:Uncharacterized protein n=1 Tax=Candidatus Thiothrix putei TaxID=3080811 RepID=A0AA95HF00_9GAMM|nr:MAG: hypothetical protein QJT81_02965 [Candidatus Thiothrix putei]
MSTPSLLLLDSPRAYREHYERCYCRGNIVTFDGIRVFFKPQKFGHAFYRNSQGRSGAKDEFCPVRAQRMDWIKATLENPDAELFMGWNKAERCHDEDRRVSVVYDDFVVVIELGLNQKGEMKGNFVTCYEADRSIDEIRKSPKWNLIKCLEKLKK